MTLRPPALADIGRFGCGNFTRQLNNTFAGIPVIVDAHSGVFAIPSLP
jgi:hypothetical protein